MFCCIGAHHQNDVTECSIRTVSNMARVMMLNAFIRGPSTVDPTLWSMAVDFGVHFLYKHMPSSNLPWTYLRNTSFHVMNFLQELK